MDSTPSGRATIREVYALVGKFEDQMNERFDKLEARMDARFDKHEGQHKEERQDHIVRIRWLAGAMIAAFGLITPVIALVVR